MARQVESPSAVQAGEAARLQRLREDGARPPSVNLRETIAHTRRLFELRDALHRAR
jgi:hypothetical protein